MKLKIKDVLVVGGAIFAMLFGAGNLIFPPYIGASSGSNWFTAAIAFCIASPVLSFLGILAFVKAGDRFEDFISKIGKGFGLGLGTILMLLLGPLLAVPRTGATAFEIGFAPAFPDLSLWAFSAIYFGAVLFFTLYPGNLMDKVGEILTPLLILILMFIIFASVFNPISEPIQLENGTTFFSSFLGGYHTLDSLGAILLLVIAMKAIEDKGYISKADKSRMALFSGLIAVALMGAVYIGLTFMGAYGGVEDLQNYTRSSLLIKIVNTSLGSFGRYTLSAAVSLACFSTAVGLISASAMFFYDIFKKRISYKTLVIIVTLVSMIISNLGVEAMVSISAPMLEIIYPGVIMLIILNILSHWFPRELGFKMGVYTAISISSLILLTSSNVIENSFLSSLLKNLPLSEYGFSWLLPSMVMAIMGSVIDKNMLLKKNPEINQTV